MVVLPQARTTNAEIARVVQRQLGSGWRVQRLTRGSQLVLLTGHSTHPVGTPAHAASPMRQPGAATQHDVQPCRGRRAGAGRRRSGGPPARRGFLLIAQNPPVSWVRDLLRWTEAMAEMSAAASGGAGIRIGHPDSGYTFHPKLGAAGLDLTTDRDVIDGDDDAWTT